MENGKPAVGMNPNAFAVARYSLDNVKVIGQTIGRAYLDANRAKGKARENAMTVGFESALQQIRRLGENLQRIIEADGDQAVREILDRLA